MTLDKAEQVVQTLAAALSRKSPILVHRMSELQGYSFKEITIAMKLRVAREYQHCGDDPSALAAFQKRVDSAYGALAAGMRGQFVADSKIDELAHLSPYSREFQFAMTRLANAAWMGDENDPDYQGWLQEETITSFANYCHHVGVDDPLYWQKIYTHLGIPYEPRSHPNSPRTAVHPKLLPPHPPSPKPPTEPEDEDYKGFKGAFYKGAAILMLCGGLWCLWNEYSFVFASSTTTGTLTSTPTSHIAGGRKSRHTEYHVDYAFAVGGRAYTGSDSIRRYPSSHVTVYYERANPSNNKAEYPETWVGWVLSALGAFGAVVVFQPWKSFRLNRNV